MNFFKRNHRSDVDRRGTLYIISKEAYYKLTDYKLAYNKSTYYKLSY